MPLRTVDISRISSYDPPGVFTRIDPEVEALIPRDSEIIDRVKGCVKFCHLLGVDKDRPIGDGDLKSRRKYLRAALAEFASLDEAAQIDHAAGLIGSATTILESTDPRLHVVRLLRHSNIHLKASRLEFTSHTATWDGPNGVERFEYLAIYAIDLAGSVARTQQAERYSAHDLSEMTSWLESEQTKWGIHHLILRTAELYVKELLEVTV